MKKMKKVNKTTEKRTVRVELRLTQTEYDRLRTLSEKSGLNISSVIRHLIVGAQLKATPPAELLSEFVWQIRRLGSLLNQLLALAYSKKFMNDREVRTVLDGIRECEKRVVDTYSMENS